MDYSAAKELGLTAFLTLGIFGLCVWIVKHVVTSYDIQMKAHANALHDIAIRIAQAESESREAHHFQREEHKQIVEVLAKLVGHIK